MWRCGLPERVMVVAGWCVALWGMLQFVGWLPSGSEYFVVTGPFDNPAGIGMSLSMLLPYALSQVQSEDGWKKMVGYGGVACMGMAILLSESRTGMMAACVAGTVMYASRIGRRQVFRLLGLGVLAAAILYLYKPVSANGRLFMAWIGLRLAVRHLWWGAGWEGFDLGYMTEQAAFFASHPDSAWAWVADNVKSPFNEYLLFFIRFGLSGCLMAVLAGSCWARWAKRRYVAAKRPALASLGAGAVCACFSYPSSYVILVCLGVVALAVLSLPVSLADGWPVGRWRTLLASVMLLAGVGGHVVCRCGYEHRRQALEARSAGGEQSEALDMAYQELYRMPYFATHAVFLYNYALHLYEGAKYEAASDVLGQYEKHCRDYDGRMLRAYIWMNLDKPRRAVEAFESASRMLPSRLQPRYEQVRLYEELGERSQAVRCAEEALACPVKVQSLKTNYLRDELGDYLRAVRQDGAQSLLD